MMPGKNTLTVNKAVVTEAIKLYLSTQQFKELSMPDIENIEIEKAQYTEDWSLKITLMEPEPPVAIPQHADEDKPF